MKRFFSTITSVCLISSVVFLASCAKIPGHSLSPSGTTGSTGSTASTGSTGTTGSTGSTGTTGTTGSGTTVNPAAGTPNANGIGPIAVGASNTIIFQVNGGPAITANVGAGYQVSFTCVDYGGGFTQTGVFALNSSASSTVTLGYIGNAVGIYSGMGSNIKTGVFDLDDKTGTEKINVATSSVTPTPLTAPTTPTTGTLKGTFDGTMLDANSGLMLRVSGSFNITQ